MRACSGGQGGSGRGRAGQLREDVLTGSQQRQSSRQGRTKAYRQAGARQRAQQCCWSEPARVRRPGPTPAPAAGSPAGPGWPTPARAAAAAPPGPPARAGASAGPQGCSRGRLAPKHGESARTSGGSAPCLQQRIGESMPSLGTGAPSPCLLELVHRALVPLPRSRLQASVEPAGDDARLVDDGAVKGHHLRQAQGGGVQRCRVRVTCLDGLFRCDSAGTGARRHSILQRSAALSTDAGAKSSASRSREHCKAEPLRLHNLFTVQSFLCA